MSGERVDLDELLELARAAIKSANERGTDQRANLWTISPRRDDGVVDVVLDTTLADVFDRALEVDAKFAVAAQPVVIEALVLRVRELELALEEATIALEDDDLNEYLSNAANAARDARKKCVVLP